MNDLKQNAEALRNDVVRELTAAGETIAKLEADNKRLRQYIHEVTDALDDKSNKSVQEFCDLEDGLKILEETK